MLTPDLLNMVSKCRQGVNREGRLRTCPIAFSPARLAAETAKSAIMVLPEHVPEEQEPYPVKPKATRPVCAQPQTTTSRRGHLRLLGGGGLLGASGVQRGWAA